ncbi:MAG: hypothetical protein NT062_18665, partial [Proteobacteria bacterium]|nr:hypothetical protein [Pseudomonadota bacterium]
RVDIAYDASSDTDDDGDGDPRTSRTANRVERDAATLPELEDLIRAMRSCTGATCVSDDHEFRFVWTPTKGTLVLSKLEVWERPACVPPAPPKP